MILYHGSTVRVEMPELRAGVSLLDFGAGFYTTSSYEQAERWARRKMRRENAHVGAVLPMNLILKKRRRFCASGGS